MFWRCGYDCRCIVFNVDIRIKAWPFGPIQFNSIQFSSVQFNSIQFNSIQFNSIQFNSIQFNPIQSNPIQSNPIQFILAASNAATALFQPLATSFWIPQHTAAIAKDSHQAHSVGTQNAPWSKPAAKATITQDQRNSDLTPFEGA